MADLVDGSWTEIYWFVVKVKKNYCVELMNKI